MKLDIGTPIYRARKAIRGKLIIETLWVIGFHDTWVDLGYANHKDAFECNYRSKENVARIYADTPKKAYEMFLQCQQRIRSMLEKQAEDIAVEITRHDKFVAGLNFDDFTVEVQKYDPLDAIF